jgi:4-aminobutyrate aminotransferase-like enzyme
VVLEGAYHGHTAALIDASPYKHAGPGGGGRPANVHVVTLPDAYRNPSATGHDGVRSAMAAAKHRGGVAAMLVESMPGVAGQIELPPGWLREAFATVRTAGGLAIADEVQVGLGRVGTHWWAFERAGAEPDIVTLGKPLGNGHPLAAVITRREIAEAFANGMEYFNTFGGNPVSCAAGNAVIDVIEDEGLIDRARTVGAHVRRGLDELAARHPLVGDVRGAGMFLGLELVVDRDTKEPAVAQAAYVVERARSLGVLLSVDGLHHNVLKLKPPLAFGVAEADRVIDLFDALFAEDGAQPGST